MNFFRTISASSSVIAFCHAKEEFFEKLCYARKRNGKISDVLSCFYYMYFTIHLSLNPIWFDTQSLIAHDEGLYAEELDLFWGLGTGFHLFTPHHKTVGSYWPVRQVSSSLAPVIGPLDCQVFYQQ